MREWNKLHADGVNATSANIFRADIDQYLAMACYGGIQKLIHDKSYALLSIRHLRLLWWQAC